MTCDVDKGAGGTNYEDVKTPLALVKHGDSSLIVLRHGDSWLSHYSEYFIYEFSQEAIYLQVAL